MRAKIVGTGSYVPSRVLTNAEICTRAPTSDEWIRTRFGIEERRIAAPDEQTSDMATAAAIRALRAANLEANELDGILLATGTGDVLAPSTAGFVQQKLNIQSRCFAFDVRLACAGPVGGLMLARGLIESQMARRVLVIGATLASRSLIDWTDRTLAPLLGDGAGAVVVAASSDETSGILESCLYTDGSLTHIIGQPGGGTREPLTAEVVDARRHLYQMDGKAVWACAEKVLPSVILEVLARRGLSPKDMDFLVPHQANRNLLVQVLKEIDFPIERTAVNVNRYGNTASASVFVALDESVRAGRIRAGQHVVLAAIGAGMTWGAHLLKW